MLQWFRLDGDIDEPAPLLAHPRRGMKFLAYACNMARWLPYGLDACFAARLLPILQLAPVPKNVRH